MIEGREVPRGAEGEIWLRGPMVVRGYWNNPEATAESFVAGFWRSGDIGSHRRRGYVRVLDRKKDMINRGGYKIYSIEVENALMCSCRRHRGGRHCHSPARCSANARTPSCASSAQRCNASEELARHCAALLADYKVPDTFSFRSEPLPRNANGKIMKRELKDAG